MMRRAFASYWTVGAVGLVLLALHVWWFRLSDHQADVLSGGDAALGTLGIWVAARPYIRQGLQPFIRAALTPDISTYLTDSAYDAELRAIHERELPQVTRDAWAERVIAVGVIVAGAGLNGYASAIARLLGLRDIAS